MIFEPLQLWCTEICPVSETEPIYSKILNLDGYAGAFLNMTNNWCTYQAWTVLICWSVGWEYLTNSILFWFPSKGQCFQITTKNFFRVFFFFKQTPPVYEDYSVIDHLREIRRTPLILKWVPELCHSWPQMDMYTHIQKGAFLNRLFFFEGHHLCTKGD